MKSKGVCLLLSIILISGCATSRYDKAEKYIERKQYNEALRNYLKYLNPRTRGGKRYISYDKEAITGIGMIYWHMQRFETATRILKLVLDKDPLYGKAIFYQGMTMEGMGNEDEALNIYKKYTSIPVSDPYRKVIFSRRDWILRRIIAREVNQALQNEAQLQSAVVPEKSVAVLYFSSLSDDPQWRPLQKGLADMIITDLSLVEELKVVERLRLNYIIDELKLASTGIVDESTAPRVGMLLGVKNMVKGSYSVLQDLKMNIDAGIFSVNAPQISTSNSLDGNLSRLFQMEKELVLRILDYFRIEMTPIQRDKILQLPTENMEAFLNYCQGLEALDSYDYQTAQTFFEKAVDLDPAFTLAQDHYITQRMWEAAHHSNLVRVSQEVAYLIKIKPRKVEEPSINMLAKVTTWNRLQTMGNYQNAGFLPGNDSREYFEEADLGGAPVLPMFLEEPPLPPAR